VDEPTIGNEARDMNAFALPLSIMLLLVLGEQLVLARRQQYSIPWVDIVFNLNSGHILMWIFRGLEVAGYAWIWAHLSLHWVDQLPGPMVWLIAFCGWDFGFYWLHRLHHKIPLLWAVHVVHHEGEHFNLSLGIRNSWYSSLTSLPFFVPLAVLGVPPEVFVLVSACHYSVQFYNHCNLIGSSGILDRIVITPSNHRVHHGINPQYVDHNFGGTLALWDKLFGTYAPEEEEVVYGVAGSSPSVNPVWANNVPLLRCFGLSVPQRPRELPALLPASLIGAAGILLFGLVIYYIHRQGTWQSNQQELLFVLIFLSTIALGALSEGRRVGLWAWIVIAGALPLLMVIDWGVRDGMGLALAALFLIVGTASVIKAQPARLPG
jgi:sterol desaturase/sphingolipid hydroxylase (fatty acid hydroxylase superfamily)